MISVIPEQAWQQKNDINELLHEVYAIAYQQEIKAGLWPQDLPEGFDINKVQFTLDDKTTESVVTFRMIQQQVKGLARITDEFQDEPSPVLGEVLQFTTSPNHPATLKQSNQDSHSHFHYQQPIRQSLTLEAHTPSTAIIKSAQTQWQLQCINRPPIAKSMGQNQHGLFIETRLNNLDSRVYWLPKEIKTLAEGREEQRGVWFEQPEFSKDSNLIRDEYGIYQELSIQGINQRFRWIEPGIFMMGSPENEIDRYDDEDLHQVTLTRGFWLADTTVTQILWQAVMKDNPSSFKGKNKPVEQVSWEDADKFIQKMGMVHSRVTNSH